MDKFATAVKKKLSDSFDIQEGQTNELDHNHDDKSATSDNIFSPKHKRKAENL